MEERAEERAEAFCRRNCSLRFLLRSLSRSLLRFFRSGEDSRGLFFFLRGREISCALGPGLRFLDGTAPVTVAVDAAGVSGGGAGAGGSWSANTGMLIFK